MRSNQKRVAYVCARCGSSNVISDALAQWNARTQEWMVVGHYDSSECLDCEKEQKLIEVELTPRS